MALRRGRPDRWTDRVEDLASWVLLAAGLLLVLFACTTGIGIHDRLVQQGRAEALDRTPTSATLLERAPTLASAYSDGTPMAVNATWDDRWGVERTGSVSAPEGLAKGSTLQIWIDQSGAPVPKPTTSGDALALAGIITGLVIVAGVVVLALLWVALHRGLMAYNCAAWEQEWRVVAPLWSPDGGKLGGLSSLGAGTALLVVDTQGRDAAGFIATPAQRFTGEGYALVADPMRLRQAAGDADLPGVVGQVRIRAIATSPSGVFVGIGPSAAVQSYLAPVAHSALTPPQRDRAEHLDAIHGRWSAFDAARAGVVLGGDGVGYGRSGAAVGTRCG